ncbi:MAG: 3-hydroxyacyl-ACP dehydratase FabZ [Ottowia sp.]|nr:3-hydroxyacyl-ACP dehydratase FabZ [Ottowia sp.]
MMDIYHILDKLPHRYPFLLVDRVLDIDVSARTIRAVKNVTVNEPFFTGHFPRRPVMPGVLIIEAMAQACALLTFEVEQVALQDNQVFYFVGVDGARFKRPVAPGDQLILHGEIERARALVYRFKCRAMVDDELACEAIVMCTMREVS